MRKDARNVQMTAFTALLMNVKNGYYGSVSTAVGKNNIIYQRLF